MTLTNRLALRLFGFQPLDPDGPMCVTMPLSTWWACLIWSARRGWRL